VSWRDSLPLVPTRNRELLASLLGSPIIQLSHYADPADELLAEHAYAARGVAAKRLFSLADGPALLVAGEGAICVWDCEELASVAVQLPDLEELNADWPSRIEATDDRFSEPRFSRLIGRRIVGVSVLQEVVNPQNLDFITNRGRRNIYSIKILDRPREAALVFELDDSSRLILGRRFIDAPANLAIMTDEDLVDPEFEYAEVMRLPENQSSMAARDE
jgi:hypothetical protein